MRVARSSGWGALALTIVLAAGCGGDGSGDDGGAVGASPATTAAATSAPATAAPTTTATELGPTDSAPAAPASAAGRLEVTDAIVLDRDGLGLVDFGDDAGAAVAALTAVLGEPTEDSGWVEPASISTCAGTELRAVAWGSLDVYLADESAIASDRRHVFGYSYGHVSDLEAAPEGLATPDGIGLGTTVEFLLAAYPEAVVEPGEDGIITPNFYVDDGLSGRLTGAEGDDLVTVIIGGDPCAVGM